MTRRHATALPVLTSILAVLCVRRAFADAPPCAPHGDRGGRLREHPLARADRPRSRGVRGARRHRPVRPRRADDATAPPSRWRRSCRTAAPRPDPCPGEDDVVPTLEALLLVPQRSARAQVAAVEPSASGPPASSLPAPPSVTSPPAARPVPSDPRPVRDRDASSASPGPRRPSPSRLRIELSVITGARMGDGQVGVGLGAFSLLDLSRWLVGFEGRADRYKTLASGVAGVGRAGARGARGPTLPIPDDSGGSDRGAPPWSCRERRRSRPQPWGETSSRARVRARRRACSSAPA